MITEVKTTTLELNPVMRPKNLEELFKDALANGDEKTLLKLFFEARKQIADMLAAHEEAKKTADDKAYSDRALIQMLCQRIAKPY